MNSNPVILPHIYSQPDNPGCIISVNTANVFIDMQSLQTLFVQHQINCSTIYSRETAWIKDTALLGWP